VAFCSFSQPSVHFGFVFRSADLICKNCGLPESTFFKTFCTNQQQYR
jgi:hypothetical protein